MPPKSAYGKPPQGNLKCALRTSNDGLAFINLEATTHTLTRCQSVLSTPRLEISRGFRYHSGLEFQGCFGIRCRYREHCTEAKGRSISRDERV